MWMARPAHSPSCPLSPILHLNPFSFMGRSNRKKGRPQEVRPAVSGRSNGRAKMPGQLHPLVAPQVSHLRHVPLRTRVKFPHSPQESPS